MFRPYLSWSSYDLFCRDQQKWYLKYAYGIEEPANDKMKIGKIFSEAYADPAFDYRTALRKENIPPSALTMFESLKDARLIRPELCEVKIECTIDGVPLIAYFDALRPWDDLIIENKTGAPWTQERADEHGQLTLYGIMYGHVTPGSEPKYLLQSIDPKGRLLIFTTTRSQEQKQQLWNNIKKVWAEMKELESRFYASGATQSSPEKSNAVPRAPRARTRGEQSKVVKQKPAPTAEK